MAGKSVNRLRAQVLKFRFQWPGRGLHEADGHVSDVAAHPSSAMLNPNESRDRPGNQDYPPKAVVQSLRRKRLPAQLTRGVKVLAAPLVWFCLLAFCGGTGVAAFLWLTTLPPVVNCQKLQPSSADMDKLDCAEQAARSGNVKSLLAGLALVKNWSADHPLSIRANRAVKEWSNALLTIAQTKADQGDLTGAIALAKKIPANSPMHAEAQRTLVEWQKGQNRGQTIEAAIQTALKQQDWQTAAAKLSALASLDDKNAQRNLSRLRQQLTTERTAYEQLQQARQTAERNPENVAAIGQAIALAERIDASSYAHSEAQNSIQAWGQFLLNRLTEQLGQADTAGAIATAQQLPLSLPLPLVGRDLLWLSHAQPLTAKRLFNTSPQEHSRELLIALAQVRQIRADSPLYAQAKRLEPLLEQQMQDTLQIQMAIPVGSLKQIPTLHAAIAIMQTITPNRPQRLYAQTLIAQWQKEIQQLEDRPYLLQAQQLATAGTLSKLKAAIAQAQQIAPKRALRLDAQSAIAKWTRQIQTIEDQPLLDQAKTFAKQKKLPEAIQTAAKIGVNRALYKDAQAAINTWQAEIQLAEDQPILDEARALADRGRLTNAINLASKIGFGRALYGDAQAAIARWSSQRDAILAARRPTRLYEPSPPAELYRRPPGVPDEPPLSPPALPPELPPP